MNTGTPFRSASDQNNLLLYNLKRNVLKYHIWGQNKMCTTLSLQLNCNCLLSTSLHIY